MAGVDSTKLSAWNWIKTGDMGMGNLLSSEHNAILGEVSEDYVSFNWLIQQGYATSAQMNAALSNYLPLSGGTMTGSIGLNNGSVKIEYNNGLVIRDYENNLIWYFNPEGSLNPTDLDVLKRQDLNDALGDISALIHAT